MRINKFIAHATGLSRRAADHAVVEGRVRINGISAEAGSEVKDTDRVTLDDSVITPAVNTITIMLNKPVGYVVSRNGQGSHTIYDLLPPELHHLKPVGRLDKDSSGLLLLTNDGTLAQQLTHPRFQKEKVYHVRPNKPLQSADKQAIEQGIRIDDYTSRLRLSAIENRESKIDNCSWQVAMSMGHNRQIRRTFAARGYTVTRLHRTCFGMYILGALASGSYQSVF